MCKNTGNASSLGVNQVEVDESNVDFNRIYLYDNLSFGKPADGNREINQAHIRSIFKHFDEDQLGTILVDIETKNILDGNHRWYAIKKYLENGSKLTKPIRVIYVRRPKGMTVAESIAYYNGNRKSWTAQDHIVSKANQGDKYAIELREFCNSRKWLHTEKVNKVTGEKTLSPIMRYGGWFIKGINCSPLFKKNLYEHKDWELNEGKEVYNEIEKIMDAAGITKTGTWFGEMVSAWRRVRYEQKDKINSLPDGFNSLIPEFEKRIYVKEETLANQIGVNMRNFESVIDDAVADAA